MSKSLGSRIRELRKAIGLTQRQLADVVGIDFTYLSKIENNMLPYSPSTKTLKNLARELKVDELELLRLAEKLPTDMGNIARTEQGIRLLRQASKLKSPEEWEELLTFLEEKTRGDEE
jgi:HTH-type transcriptional regulator, competence development regulator